MHGIRTLYPINDPCSAIGARCASFSSLQHTACHYTTHVRQMLTKADRSTPSKVSWPMANWRFSWRNSQKQHDSKGRHECEPFRPQFRDQRHKRNHHVAELSLRCSRALAGLSRTTTGLQSECQPIQVPPLSLLGGSNPVRQRTLQLFPTRMCLTLVGKYCKFKSVNSLFMCYRYLALWLYYWTCELGASTQFAGALCNNPDKWRWPDNGYCCSLMGPFWNLLDHLPMNSGHIGGNCATAIIRCRGARARGEWTHLLLTNNYVIISKYSTSAPRRWIWCRLGSWFSICADREWHNLDPSKIFKIFA